MKKFNATKMMALLMALCLITSTFVGSTLAKYTTSETANDTARVAKFGVTIEANGTTFANAYDAGASAQTVISSNTAEKVVAPGTAGELAECTLAGTPEVAVNVSYVADLTLTGWKDADDNEYCPIVITVNGTPYEQTSTLAAFEEAVEDAIAAYSADYAANQNLAEEATVSTPDVSWAWAFDNTKADAAANQNDVDDTFLGDEAAAGRASTIDLKITTTVTQID